MEIAVPVMRADFTIADTYSFKDGPPLPISITAFGGDRDPEVPENMIAAWRGQTAGKFRQKIFPGGIFSFNRLWGLFSPMYCMKSNLIALPRVEN